MPDAKVLSEADQKLLQTWLDWSRRQPRGDPAGLGPDVDLSAAPEVYIARTPTGGIPALVAGSGGALDKPGVASCAVWRILGTSTRPELKAVEGLKRTVHNLTTAVIPADQWVLVAREKFGSWVAVQGGGGGGGGAAGVPIRVTSATPGPDGLYDGELLSYNPPPANTFTVLGPIKVRDLNAAP
jgi:hypothetical protein